MTSFHFIYCILNEILYAYLIFHWQFLFHAIFLLFVFFPIALKYLIRIKLQFKSNNNRIFFCSYLILHIFVVINNEITEYFISSKYNLQEVNRIPLLTLIQLYEYTFREHMCSPPDFGGIGVAHVLNIANVSGCFILD